MVTGPAEPDLLKVTIDLSSWGIVNRQGDHQTNSAFRTTIFNYSSMVSSLDPAALGEVGTDFSVEFFSYCAGILHTSLLKLLNERQKHLKICYAINLKIKPHQHTHSE
jgi:hypothetical protein